MKHTHVLICLMFCFISSIDCDNKSIDTRPKKVQSEEKLKIVQSLTEKLQKKKISLDQNSQIFEQEILTNVQEIQFERRKGSGNDFKSAMSNKRIENSLKAIQKASAYKEVVTHEAEKTEAGVIELEGTTKQLRLDITVLGALEDEKGDEILAQLDLVINHIQPQAGDLVISPDTPKKPLEDIYEKYIREPERIEEKKQQLERERTQLEQKKREEAAKIEQQKREELARLEQLKKAEEDRLVQQKIVAQAKIDYELKIQREKEAEAAEQKRILEEKQRQAQIEKERLEREARELTEKKRQEEIARKEAEEEQNREEREQQEEKRRLIAEEKAIAHVKILSPAYEENLYFHSAKLNINWSNQESLFSLMQDLKIIIKEIKQNSTVIIEADDLGVNRGDLYFIDLAFSDDNSKLAILAGPSRIGTDGKGQATLYLWSIINRKIENYFPLPSTCAERGGGACGDDFEVLGWKGNYVVVSENNQYRLFTNSVEQQPIFIINVATGKVNSTNRGYAVVWKNDDSLLAGVDAATKLLSLNTGAVIYSYNECNPSGSSDLYYNFCPSPLKVMDVCYASSTGTMTNRTAAGDNDIRSSTWDTIQKKKTDWEKLGDNDSWCACNADDPVVNFSVELNTELPQLRRKLGSSKEAVFLKNQQTTRTIAMLKIEYHTFDSSYDKFKSYFSPRGDYLLMTDSGYVCAWDISSL